MRKIRGEISRFIIKIAMWIYPMDWQLQDTLKVMKDQQDTYRLMRSVLEQENKSGQAKVKN